MPCPLDLLQTCPTWTMLYWAVLLSSVMMELCYETQTGGIQLKCLLYSWLAQDEGVLQSAIHKPPASRFPAIPSFDCYYSIVPPFHPWSHQWGTVSGDGCSRQLFLGTVLSWTPLLGHDETWLWNTDCWTDKLSTPRQLCDDANDTALIGNNWVTPKCFCNPFSTDYIAFNGIIIASVIAELSQHWLWRYINGP